MSDSRGRYSPGRRVALLLAVSLILIGALTVYARPRVLTWWFVRENPKKGAAMAIEASPYSALWREMREANAVAGVIDVIRVREKEHPSLHRTEAFTLVHMHVGPAARAGGATWTFEREVENATRQPASLWSVLVMSRKRFAEYRWWTEEWWPGDVLYSDTGPNRFVLIAAKGGVDFSARIWSRDGAWREEVNYMHRDRGGEGTEECLRWLAGYLRVIEF